VHAPPQLLFDLLQLGSHTLRDRLAFDGERSLSGLPAIVREPQEVERLRLAQPSLRSTFRRVSAELDESRFVRV